VLFCLIDEAYTALNPRGFANRELH
jgi:hypothetical protein